MINKVILVGNVGADPEVRTLDSGVKVVRLRLATTERFVDRQTNETREQTEWHTVTMWRALADVADKYVRKGSQLYIEGSLRTREWTDRDNQKRYTTEIVANDMKLLGRRPEGTVPQQSAAPAAAPQQPYAPQQQYAPQPQPQYAPQPALQLTQVVVPADDADDLPF